MTRFLAGLGTSVAASEREAVDEALASALAQLDGAKPGLAILGTSVGFDVHAVVTRLREQLPDVPLHGLTTSIGLLGSRGILKSPSGSLGVMLLAAEGVNFAVSGSRINGDPGAVGRRVAEQLRDQLPSEPKLLLFNAAPGAEEGLLAGVADVFPRVPVFGGSAADDLLRGDWKVITNDAVRSDALALAGVCGSLRCGGALLAPYTATTDSALVTQADDRCLLSLDRQPAAAKLREWLGESISEQAQTGGTILAESALAPLGLRLDTGRGMHYLTIHPAQIHAETGGVSVFARVNNRQRLYRMHSDPQRLTGSIALLLQRALERAKIEDHEVRAALLIYCAGCATAVGDDLHAALQEHLRVLGDIPILGLCTFGEQGPAGNAGNVHANLSLAMVVFGDS
ncbi:FIST signal transduction protein [Enhygromyxa salina]|uniref:FIST N domain protein n=1 Tax=Enhygromyxa salina TaxID=215803 RepID=A0A2S9YDK9_9BACT|nr:FIST N-terminal domain-containing protein [Enhygromyxa salina]PRQ03096.1 FIST N domain protein [Enhygromyxa salina]